MSDVSPDTLIMLAGMIANFIGMSVWLGRITGQMTVRLTEHEKRHIRNEARIDEHNNRISEHDKQLAVLEDRNKRK